MQWNATRCNNRAARMKMCERHCVRALISRASQEKCQRRRASPIENPNNCNIWVVPALLKRPRSLLREHPFRIRKYFSSRFELPLRIFRVSAPDVLSRRITALRLVRNPKSAHMHAVMIVLVHTCLHM